MKSLRVRFFLVVWPLVVTALVMLGLVLGRISRVELQRISLQSTINGPQRVPGEAMIAAVRRSGNDSASMSAALAAITSTDTTLLGAAVVGKGDEILASSIPGLTPGIIHVDAEGSATYTRSFAKYGGTSRVVMKLQASAIPGAVGRWLVAVPSYQRMYDDAPVVPPRDPFAALSRRILLAVVAGSLLAGLATLLISQPLLGRVGELSRATIALRRGDLAARVTQRGNDELGELGRAFNDMAAGLQASEVQRRRMVSDVAHELRTPLTNVIGLIESVRDGLREPDERLMTALHEEAGLLNRLIDDLRDLSLADADELPLTVEVLSAATAAKRAVEAFPSGPGYQRTVLRVASPDLTVRADPKRLGQVLRNLIQNARMYSPADSVITVDVDRHDGRTRFRVSDQGNGISADDLPHVWERFYRVDSSRTKGTGGMGLGLALVSRLVEAQHGRVGVESTVGSGSSFTIELPD